MANQAAERLGLELRLTSNDFDNDDTYVGERYGVPTQAGLEAIRLVAQTEGILLDPVYTGKAMSALIEHIEAGAAAERHAGDLPAHGRRAGALCVCSGRVERVGVGGLHNLSRKSQNEEQP